MCSFIRTILKPLKNKLEPAGYWLAYWFYSLTHILRVTPRLNSLLTKPIGINFIGYSQGELGLGQAMRALVFSCRTAFIPLVVRPFATRLTNPQTNLSLNQWNVKQCQYPVNVICVNPDLLYRLPLWLHYAEWAKTYNIGYWFWELENFPPAWRYATKIVDEIWVATDFIAQAMRKSGLPVIKIPFALEFEPPSPNLNRNYFKLPTEDFIFLYSFDYNSVPDRKNPHDLIRAFQAAFPVHTSVAQVRLILKTTNASYYDAYQQSLKLLIGGDLRIELRDTHLNTSEMRGLINCADCYVSLHRAEGLGLGLAEAMYLGKPTIATAYSGNLEFMNKHNSILVPYTLVPIPRESYPNSKGQYWAQVDIEAAAKSMQALAVNPARGLDLGKRAAADMRAHHSLAVAGKQIEIRLNQIKEKLRTT